MRDVAVFRAPGLPGLLLMALLWGPWPAGRGQDNGAPTPLFSEVASRVGLDFKHFNGASGEFYLPEIVGSGAALLDYDGDGDLDVYLIQSTMLEPGKSPAQAWFAPDPGWKPGHRLFRNELIPQGSLGFTDVTTRAGVGSVSYGMGVATGDYDNDGDLDFYLTNYGPNYLYRNNGDGTFTDISGPAGVDIPGKALGVVTGDMNDDGFADIYVANDAVANFLFKNNGDGTFKEIGVVAGAAYGIYGKAESGMGADFGDYDGDGRIDLIITNIDQEMNNLFANQGDDWFIDLTLNAGLGQVATLSSGFGVRFLDYDNDGDLDLVILNGHVVDNIDLYRYGVLYAEPPLLLENTGEGRFSDAGKEAGPIWEKPMVGRALAAGDYDNDGDSDLLFVNNGEPAVLLRNDGGNANPWLGLQLVGSKSNRDAVGAIVTMTTDRRKILRERSGGTSYQAAQDPRIIFGLEEGEKIISLEVRWPSGAVQHLDPLEMSRYHTLRE